jgi:hypothetical protein
MTNVVKTPEKKWLRTKLVRAGLETLEKEGWTVAKVSGAGKGRVRRISKGNVTKLAAIRTTQDTWIAFPRNEDDTAWVTLSDVDVVVAISVDDPEHPQFAKVHFLDAGDLRSRFDRAYQARRDAGHSIPIGRGVWLSLYDDEGTSPVQRVGAGAGNIQPPKALVPLGDPGPSSPKPPSGGGPAAPDADGASDDGGPLTIAQAKIRLARTLGVDPSSIKITVEA